MTDDRIAFCYHALSRDWPAVLSVTPDQFEFQIRLLASRGYRGTTFTEAALSDDAGRCVAITFDDGYLSVLERAKPILDRHGFAGTVFVPTAFVDRDEPMAWDGIDQWVGGPYQSELTPLSWHQLRSLCDAGWEVGSHTVTHPRLTRLGDGDLREELVESRRECERQTGTACSSLALPYGDSDQRVLEEAQAAGYTAVGLLDSRLARDSQVACPRVGVYHDDGPRAFRMKVSPLVRRLRRSPAWTPIGKVLHRLRRS
jgi:peptidoglycan/xylan/chitin deacetylase (PgdA/CDA1 family)